VKDTLVYCEISNLCSVWYRSQKNLLLHNFRSKAKTRRSRQEQQYECRSHASERRKKQSETEKRQGEAAVRKVAERAHNEESTEQHLFTKYLDIRMIKEDCTRIVTCVDFVLDRACWTLMMSGFTSLTPTSFILSLIDVSGRRSVSSKNL
jgi:hypothetical protein